LLLESPPLIRRGFEFSGGAAHVDGCLGDGSLLELRAQEEESVRGSVSAWRFRSETAGASIESTDTGVLNSMIACSLLTCLIE